MTKKIIAVSLVILMIATCFVACGKDKGYKVLKDKDGFEHAYVTDAEGNTVLDENGNARVYQTEANGEIATDENGNKKENIVKLPDTMANADGSVKTSIFVLPAIKGWNATDNGKLIKKDTESNCYITADYAATATEENTFKMMIDKVIEGNKSAVDSINAGEFKDKGYAKADMESKFTTYKGYQASYMTYTVYDASNKIVHHAETLYFVTEDGRIYVISYANVNGAGYDESFDFLTWADTVTVKVPPVTTAESTTASTTAKK